MRSVAPRTSGDSRSRAGAHRRARQRQHDVHADRPQQRALARHVRAADDDHARAGAPPSRTSLRTERSSGISGWPSAVAVEHGPVRRQAPETDPPGARTRTSPAPPALRFRRWPAATRPRRGRRRRASDRSPPPAAASRAAGTAIGANIMLCVESTHDTSAPQLRDAARRRRRRRSPAPACSAVSRGDVNALPSRCARAATSRSARSRSGVSTA